MLCRLFQLEVSPGRPQVNAQKMLEAIARAKADAVDLILFPEMSIPGYLLGDEWERDSFLVDCERCGEDVKKASVGITVIFGNVAVDWHKKNEDGRPRKYNALFVAEDGCFIKHCVTQQDFFIKMLMPNYREFDDNRHFFDPRKLAFELGTPLANLVKVIKSKHGNIGGFLCEDGWDEDYNLSPLSILSEQAPIAYVNLSSSPYTFDKNQKRHRVFSKHAQNFGKPLFYVNNTGLQDNGKTLFTFDGASRVYLANGDVCCKVTDFDEGFCDFDLSTTTAPIPTKQTQQNNSEFSKESLDGSAKQFEAICYGLQKFMARIGLTKVVIGVSGGIDSALVASIFRSFLESDDIHLVSMPGPFTSETTKQLSRSLAEALDCPFTEIPIEPSVRLSQRQLRAARFKNSTGYSSLEISDFVMENIQARDRSSRILAGVAAALGGAFTCNANKSEMTVGYSTLYGDLGGFIAPIADLWKGEVYQMAKLINAQVYSSPVIPQGSIDIVPSAELSSSQNVDKNEGDPLHYPYHDKLFASWVERWRRATPEDNLCWFLDGNLEENLGLTTRIDELFLSPKYFIDDLERWWNLYQGMAIAKRIQAPPVLAIKRRAFGFDHRESQLGPRFSANYQDLKEIALNKRR